MTGIFTIRIVVIEGVIITRTSDVYLSLLSAPLGIVILGSGIYEKNPPFHTKMEGKASCESVISDSSLETQPRSL